VFFTSGENTMDCIFCKISAGELPATILYRDEQVLAFQDLHPRAPQHTLIIPHKHISTLNDLTEAESSLVGHMVKTASDLAKQQKIADSGYRVVFNCNAGAGQTVFHIHLHILGGRPMEWPPG
jgi:histidine triad (HIT) family protein